MPSATPATVADVDAQWIDGLLSVFSEGQSRRDVRLQTLGRAGQLALDVALGAVDVVTQNMQSRPISLCLDGHFSLRW